MKQKLITLFIIAAMSVSFLLAACGEEQVVIATIDELPTDAPVITETTVVLETTADGGTIEQDSEENKITKDKDGKVIRVEDKNGNELIVTEYLTTHSWVENPGDVSGGNGASSGKESGSAASSQAGKDGSSGKGDEKVSSGSQGEGVEEEIPVVIATIPDDDDDMIVLD